MGGTEWAEAPHPRPPTGRKRTGNSSEGELGFVWDMPGPRRDRKPTEKFSSHLRKGQIKTVPQDSASSRRVA